MLVLSRGKDEKIIIEHVTGERIEVTVCRVGFSKVRIGIDADRDWRIFRNELETKANELLLDGND